MKRFSLFMAVAIMSLVGCSEDSFNENFEKEAQVNLKIDATESVEVRALNEIIDAYKVYYKGGDDDTGIVMNQVFDLSASSKNFLGLTGSDKVVLNELDLDRIVIYPKEVSNNLSLSAEAGYLIDDFFNSTIKSSSDIDMLLNNLIDNITSNMKIDEEEKLVVLNACLLTIKCRGLMQSPSNGGDDDDWSRSNSIMAAGLSGGIDSPAQAVLNAAVVTALTL
ncbi:hypothetical protein [Flavobacterium sp. C4GT6]|uniref:hypothetical protein n=1 Tax=Flavobacterium sp. C4GT6 TaxID=3103818 RepID=UPI002ED0B906